MGERDRERERKREREIKREKEWHQERVRQTYKVYTLQLPKAHCSYRSHFCLTFPDYARHCSLCQGSSPSNKNLPIYECICIRLFCQITPDILLNLQPCLLWDATNVLIYIGATPVMLSIRFQTIQDNAVCAKDQSHPPSTGPLMNLFVFDLLSASYLIFYEFSNPICFGIQQTSCSFWG